MLLIWTVEQTQGKRPPAFAQEPDYNDLDTALLSSLHITKVNHPTAFCLLTPASFAYCPGAELFVILRTLAFDPAIYLGNALDRYYAEDRPIPSKTIRNKLPVNSKEPALNDLENTDRIDPRGMVGRHQNTQLECSRVVGSYKKDKDVASLPNLDVKDYPFYDQHLHWRPPASIEQVGAIPWSGLVSRFGR